MGFGRGGHSVRGTARRTAFPGLPLPRGHRAASRLRGKQDGELLEKKNSRISGVRWRLVPCLVPESPFCKRTELSDSLFLILDPADRDPALGGGGDSKLLCPREKN